MKIKKSFVAFGVFLALAGTFCVATLPKFARRAEALVLVKDPANIAEAIKIVTNTLDILSAEQQQIVLQLLNMKKLDPSDLTKFRTIFLKDQTTSNNIVNGEGDYALSGILSGKLSIPTSWDSMLGSVTDILNGQGNSGGCFGTGKPGLILLSRVGKDAVVSAKMAQQQDLESGKLVLEAVEKSQQAEGEMQAIQAGNTILAAQAQSIEHGNQILANLTAVLAANAQRENLERAQQIKAAENTAEYARKFSATLPTYGE